MIARRIFAGMVMITAGCLTVSGAALAAPQKSPEKAASDVRARELFQKGDTAYAEGRYEEALAAFQEAYDLSGRPQLLFNVSNALERLGKYQEAVDALEKYLQSGKARDRDVVQKRLANLRKRVDEQKKEAAAKEEEEKKKQLEAQQKADAEAAAKPATTGPVVDTPPAKADDKPTPIVPIVVLGAGAAALVTSGVFAILTSSARSDVDAGCKDSPSGRLCTSDTSSAIDRDKTFGLVTDIALLSGLVLGGVGVYLLVTSNDGKSSVKVGAGSRGTSASAKGVKIGARPFTTRTGAGAALVGTF